MEKKKSTLKQLKKNLKSTLLSTSAMGKLKAGAGFPAIDLDCYADCRSSGGSRGNCRASCLME